MKFIQMLTLMFISMYAAQAIEWQEVDVPTAGTVECFFQKGDDILLGANGIKVSNDAGVTFSYSNKLEDFSIEGIDLQNNIFFIRSVYITDAGNYITVPSNVPILYSTDKGEYWHSSEMKVNGRDCKFYETSNGLYLVHRDGVLLSEDDGKTWTEILTLEEDEDASYFEMSGNDEILFVLTDDMGENRNMLVFNCTTKSKKTYNMDKILDDFYLFEDKLYGFDDGYMAIVDTLWQSSDYGQTWQASISTTNLIVEQLQLNAEYYYHNVLLAEKGVIAVDAICSDFDMENTIIISFDNGSTWTKIENAEYDRDIYYFDSKVENGDFYFNYLGWNKYNKENHEFTKVDFDFQDVKYYRDYGDQKISVVNTSTSRDLWENSDGNWSYIQNFNEVNQFYFAMSGEYFEVDIHDLVRYYDGQIDTIAGSQTGDFKILREYQDGSILMILYDEDGSYDRNAILLKNGVKTLLIKDTKDGFDYDPKTNTFYYVESYDDKKPMLFIGSPELGVQDSLELKNQGDINYISDFSYQGNTMIYQIGYLTYLSDDGGQTFIFLEYDNQNLIPMSVKVYADKYYLNTALGLLCSEDGITWESLLEDTFNGNVYVVNYEFDLEGYIYAYTTMGTFKSAEPVSVAEESNKKAQNISINIYPNPSSDVLNFDFNGQVENTAVVDLNGNVISCPQTLNSLDISELSSGAYFLKVTSNGKTYYRQFVKAE